MPDKKLSKLLHAKSYSSIYDMFGATSYGNLIHSIGLYNPTRGQSVFRAACGESAKQIIDYDYPISKSTNYVTSEQYNTLCKESSCKAMKPSTSTIFYDLDDIVKRHSFHCHTELSISNANLMKSMKIPVIPHVFGEKSAIVQECATQIHPKLLPRDSIEINAKKVKKKISKLSSEILLRDDDYHDYQKNSLYYKDLSERQQKFWSYAKYRTEYTKPIPEEKKPKKKVKGKTPTEDPCPCQLFSYVCPCTDNKSLTELTKNSKSLTGIDQLTSTTKIVIDDKKNLKSPKGKKQKHDNVKEDKPTNTSLVEMIEVIIPNKEKDQDVLIADKNEAPIILSDKGNANKNPKSKTKSRKKSRRVLCPNCKEKVDIVLSISTTEEEESLKYDSSIYRSKQISSTTAYAYRASPANHKGKTMDDGDLCLHEPRCELLPVCQILPNDNFYNVSQKYVKKHSGPKSTPRIIRITKACRHHPPCTVVPSCQRATVLKNNCEYIPPCLHRPRCCNLPLCVPFSKSLHYEEASNKVVEDMDTNGCPHIPRCKYIPVCQRDSLSNTIDHQINMASRVQNACEFLNDYNTPAFLLNPKTTCMANTFSPCQPPKPCYTEQYICRSNKSCQFDTSHYKSINDSKENASHDTVIFIRDVGCQFRNKSYSPKESMYHSKASSNSLDFVEAKMGNYVTNIHTLRYEDKCTSPLSGMADNSFSTGSVSSMEFDSECPSHGRRANILSLRQRPTTGFMPKAAYITAFSTLRDYHSTSLTFPVKSHRSFLKGKYRKMFSVKRKKKSKISNHVIQKGSS